MCTSHLCGLAPVYINMCVLTVPDRVNAFLHIVTCVWLLSCMWQNVLPEMSSSSELILTDVTFVWISSCIYQHVSLETSRCRKLFFTDVIFVWLLTCMCEHVHLWDILIQCTLFYRCHICMLLYSIYQHMLLELPYFNKLFHSVKFVWLLSCMFYRVPIEIPTCM